MIPASLVVERLVGHGFTDCCGVPCSFLKPFINRVINDRHLNYIGATSEGEAVGISMGAHLAGRNTVTLCQNSGLGNMVNPLTSLNHPFGIPTLLIVTWRGQPGRPDEPQHAVMGAITHRLLETMDIPWRPFPTDSDRIDAVLAEATALMAERQLPVALVMSDGSVSGEELTNRGGAAPAGARAQGAFTRGGADRMTRSEAMGILLEELSGDEAVIATTGKTGRELFTIADRENHLYVVGGMGTASAIGFGIARALPVQPVVVLDGDGAALMKLGSLATIGFHQPSNLLHVVLDNECHDSTGGQQTVSGSVRFAAVAAAVNYRNAIETDDPGEFRRRVRDLRGQPGPSLLHAKIRPGSPARLGRPTVSPREVRDRFMAFLRRRGAR